MPEPASKETPVSERASRTGRRFGISLYGLIVGGITLTFSVQIIADAFAPVVVPANGHGPSGSALNQDACAQSAAQLWEALQRARRSAAEALTEQAALALFREQLDPEWALLPAARTACQPDAKSAQGLAELILLRFEEEHAVRFEARGLAAARRRVEQWVEGLGAAKAR